MLLVEKGGPKSVYWTLSRRRYNQDPRSRGRSRQSHPHPPHTRQRPRHRRGACAHRRFPRKKSLGKFKDTIRAKTLRTSGHSLSWIIANVNRTLRGWFEYFKHSGSSAFPELDGWIRQRLRSILRKRAGRRGRGRGRDHQRWPNAFFVKHGLFSLRTARALAVQSSRR